jgi:excisionase family DNA binding protein
VPLRVAAEYANRSVATLRRWIDDGLLPGHRFGPNQIEVDLNDLDRLRRRIPARHNKATS